jgi:hypothetical protein
LSTMIRMKTLGAASLVSTCSLLTNGIGSFLLYADLVSPSPTEEGG